MIAQLSRTSAHNYSTSFARTVLSNDEQRMRVFDLTVALLIARAGMADYWSEGFRDAENLLAAISLPAAEFRSANCRLQNAIFYGRRNEFGAAAFELRALRGKLQML
jgi:hypothetical protein